MATPSVRRQSSEHRRIILEPLKLLLELGFDVTQPLDEDEPRSSKRQRKASSAAAPPIWKDWGTLCNRKVVVKDSRLPNAGRGLFAAQRRTSSLAQGSTQPRPGVRSRSRLGYGYGWQEPTTTT